jgi:O-antigen ligase
LSLVCIAVVAIASVPALRSRAASIFEPGQNETRLNLWKTAVRVAEDHPIVGVGEDNWDHVFEKYRVEGFYDTTVHPHNDYLTVLVASGVPGVTSFLAIWGVALVSGFRLIRRAQNEVVKAVSVGGTTALMGFLIAGLFQNYYGTFINCLGWWFVAGLILSAQTVHQRTSAVAALSSSPT